MWASAKIINVTSASRPKIAEKGWPLAAARIAPLLETEARFELAFF